MRLYKENGTSPFGACLPSLLQMPFLIVLYTLIRGLSNTTQGLVQRPQSRRQERPQVYPEPIPKCTTIWS